MSRGSHSLRTHPWENPLRPGARRGPAGSLRLGGGSQAEAPLAEGAVRGLKGDGKPGQEAKHGQVQRLAQASGCKGQPALGSEPRARNPLCGPHLAVLVN